LIFMVRTCGIEAFSRFSLAEVVIVWRSFLYFPSFSTIFWKRLAPFWKSPGSEYRSGHHNGSSPARTSMTRDGLWHWVNPTLLLAPKKEHPF
jgi:hypothetical protein